MKDIQGVDHDSESQQTDRHIHSAMVHMRKNHGKRARLMLLEVPCMRGKFARRRGTEGCADGIPT